MQGRYFKKEIRPEIDVAALAAGNITEGEVLFDWKSFDIPNGASCMVDMVVMYRGKNGTANGGKDFECFWAKSHNGDAPTTFGDDGADVDTPGWFHQIEGKTFVDTSNGGNDNDLIYLNIISNTSTSNGVTAGSDTTFFPHQTPIVLQPEPNTGPTGFGKAYVSGIAKVTHNWGPSTMTVDGTMSTSSPILTVADLDATIALAPGDVLRDEDNNLLGTVKSVDSATQVTLEANLANASANDKIVYNTTPITLICSFEH